MNTSKAKTDFLLLKFLNARVYRANLHILDDDGNELGFRPDKLVKEWLRSLGVKWADELADGIEARTKSALLISFPFDRPFNPGETRVIRAVYTDATPPGTSRLTLLSVPIYRIELLPPNDEPFRTQIVVLPPPDYEVYVRSVDVQGHLPDKPMVKLTEKEGYYPTNTKHILDFSLPTRDYEVDFNCAYAILPGREERWLFRLYFLAVAVVTGALLATFGSLTWLNSVGQSWAGTLDSWLVGNFNVIGQSMLILSVGFLGLVTNPSTHRTKLWLLVLILLIIVMLAARVTGATSVKP